MSRLTFGGLLAYALLGLFVYVLVLALNTARRCPSTCSLGEGNALLLATLGALISAVVVSELSITKPTDVPGTRLAAGGYPPGKSTAVKSLVAFYILVWLISGMALITLGWVQYPTVPQVISAAKEWLGFAIAATYAYFGISPS